jgi:hypothetical protein
VEDECEYLGANSDERVLSNVRQYFFNRQILPASVAVNSKPVIAATGRMFPARAPETAREDARAPKKLVTGKVSLALDEQHR